MHEMMGLPFRVLEMSSRMQFLLVKNRQLDKCIDRPKGKVGMARERNPDLGGETLHYRLHQQNLRLQTTIENPCPAYLLKFPR